MQKTTLTARISSFALLALGALPVLALATPGQAATLKVSDLDLHSAQGKAVYEQRAEAVARRFCANAQGLQAREQCKVGVKVELAEKLAALQANQTQFAAR